MMTVMPTPELQVAKDRTRTWKVRYRKDKKQTSQTFEKERDAIRFANWIGKYGVDGALSMLNVHQTVSADEPTLAEWCTTHIDNLPGVTQGTVDGYRRYVRRDLGDLGPMPLTAITAERIAGWVKWMEGRGLSGKSIANVHGFISAAMVTASIAGLVNANPCRGTRLPRSIVPDKVILSHDEYTRFLGCFTPRWLPMVEVLFATGMRFGEITALRVGDVHLDAETISITKAWKKGNVLGAPKSRRSRRTIAIAPATVTVLRPLIDGQPGDRLVFHTVRGNRYTSSQFHTLAWQPALDLANGIAPMRYRGHGENKTPIRGSMTPLDPPLGKRPRVHDARHTCASWLLGAGIPINVVSAHLGHENITTTVNTYGHLLPSAQGYVRDALSLALSASRPQLLP